MGEKKAHRSGPFSRSQELLLGFFFLGHWLVSHFGFLGSGFFSFHGFGSGGFLSFSGFGSSGFFHFHFLGIGAFVVSNSFHGSGRCSSNSGRLGSGSRCSSRSGSYSGRLGSSSGRGSRSGLGECASSEETSNQGGENFVHFNFLKGKHEYT